MTKTTDNSHVRVKVFLEKTGCVFQRVFLSEIGNGSQRLADGQYRIREHLQSLREKSVAVYFRECSSLKSANGSLRLAIARLVTKAAPKIRFSRI